MIDDDKASLADLDLEAYRAPAAPAGLADRVIARVQATDEAIAMSASTRRKQVRRWLFIGGLATVLVATAMMVLVVKREPAEPTGGALVAKAPEHLVVDGVTANLDPGADVTWQRGTAVVHIAQRAGAATWAVPANHQISVDTALASIDATNATFRVEARMNFSDARTVGVTAVTAAAVALVTVVVYEGHVKVSGAGQTVIVNPGTTATIEPGKPPVEMKNIGGAPMTPTAPAVPATRDATADVWITPGGKAFIHDAKPTTTVGIITTCAHSTEITWTTPGGDGSDGMREWKAPVLTLDRGVYGYEVRCDGAAARSSSGILTSLGNTTNKQMNLLIVDKLHQSSFDRQAWPEQWQIDGHADADVSITASGVPVELRDGRFSVMMSEPALLPPLVLRAEHATLGVHYYVNRPGFVTPATVAHDKPTLDPACDPIALQQRGVEAEGRGDHHAAISSFDQSLKCKADVHTLQLAFMSACNDSNLRAAKKYWKQLSPDSQSRVQSIAFRAHFTRVQLDAP